MLKAYHYSPITLCHHHPKTRPDTLHNMYDLLEGCYVRRDAYACIIHHLSHCCHFISCFPPLWLSSCVSPVFNYLRLPLCLWLCPKSLTSIHFTVSSPFSSVVFSLCHFVCSASCDVSSSVHVHIFSTALLPVFVFCLFWSWEFSATSVLLRCCRPCFFGY